MTRAWLGSLALCVLWACDGETPHAVTAHNECVIDTNCAPDAYCDQDHGQCARTKPDRPYQVILQVRAPADALVASDGGTPPVALATLEPIELRSAPENEDVILNVPSAIRTSGSVIELIDGGVRYNLLESELTLRVRDRDDPIQPTILNTRSTADVAPNDAGVLEQVRALLNPEARYDVHVQPLKSDSERLPPVDVLDYDPREPLAVTYTAVQSRSAILLDRKSSEPLRGRRVRLEDPLTGDVLSSTTETGEDGRFTLYAEPRVFEQQRLRLAVGLASNDPWRVKIAVDSNLFSQTSVYVPEVPPPVTFSASIKDAQGKPLPDATLTIASKFALPDLGAAPPDLGDVDWCSRGSALAAVELSCSTELTITANRQGTFAVDLVPGDYQIFVTPSRDFTGSRKLATFQESVRVQTPEMGAPVVKGTLIIGDSNAARFRGTVATPAGAPSPNVRVSAEAHARAGAEFGELAQLAAYNRSHSVLTDSRGHFELSADVGYYDLRVEPPDGSGFAWMVWPNHAIGETDLEVGTQALRGPIQPPYPVFVSGTVRFQDKPLPFARIEAFALVEVAGERRSVHIGRATSDGQGDYRLALPPRSENALQFIR